MAKLIVEGYADQSGDDTAPIPAGAFWSVVQPI
jgi:hypothetical protein